MTTPQTPPTNSDHALTPMQATNNTSPGPPQEPPVHRLHGRAHNTNPIQETHPPAPPPHLFCRTQSTKRILQTPQDLYPASKLQQSSEGHCSPTNGSPAHPGREIENDLAPRELRPQNYVIPCHRHYKKPTRHMLISFHSFFTVIFVSSLTKALKEPKRWITFWIERRQYEPAWRAY